MLWYKSEEHLELVDIFLVEETFRNSLENISVNDGRGKKTPCDNTFAACSTSTTALQSMAKLLLKNWRKENCMSQYAFYCSLFVDTNSRLLSSVAEVALPNWIC